MSAPLLARLPVWKLIEAEDGPFSAEDLMVVSVLLADATRRAERRTRYGIGREREVWEKLQPVLREAQGWTARGGARKGRATTEDNETPAAMPLGGRVAE